MYVLELFFIVLLVADKEGSIVDWVRHPHSAYHIATYHSSTYGNSISIRIATSMMQVILSIFQVYYQSVISRIQKRRNFHDSS